MKYACDYCGKLHTEKDLALKCERACLGKVCEAEGHDWWYHWSFDDYTDNDMLYRACRRCSKNGGVAAVHWNEGWVRELMGQLFEVAKKEAGR